MRLLEQQGLRELEDRCIQEHAPACAAACPVHVDVRAMIVEIIKGDFAAGLRILKKAVPFPGVIGHICDQPCREACKRKEAGEAIEIAALERACATWGTMSGKKIAVLPARGKRVAVVGGGLSGLTATFDLARKGWAAVIFEAGARLGGSLWAIPERDLPRQVILDDVSVLENVGVEVRLSVSVGEDVSLADLREEFDAVYLGVGADARERFGLERDGQGRIKVDALTFAASQEGIFAGGSLLRPEQERSPILSISEGRRAALSIDRYLQKVSLSAARYNEGPYQTRLYASTEGIESLPAVPVSDPEAGYRPDEAIREAQRCLQCQCLECVKVCEYLAHYKSYPKKYLRQIYNNLSIVQGRRSANQFINSCSLCGLCGQVCPTDLDMGTICREARQVMMQQERMPPSAHDFALRDMHFSNGDKFALARNQPGTATSAFLFFPGCQLSGSAPEQVARTYAYLRERLFGGVGLMLRCCGAPADWAGRPDLFQAALDELRAGYAEMGRPRVILACSTCYQMFQTHLPDVEIVSLWELFDEMGLPDGAASAPPGVVAVHDPCTTRYEHQIHDSVRSILHRLGWRIEELRLSREMTACCSYGGLMWLANPELAHAVIERRIAESDADYVTYCAMCRDSFASQGKQTWHLLDFILGDAQAEQKSIGYSQRHENRARLKRRLLKELWGEKMDGQAEYETIKLSVSEEVEQLLEERLILVEDIQQVIDYAERTGNKFLNRETGHSLARHRPAKVTYWVEYTEQDGTFVVHKAYSHRMEILESVRL
jgi:glutamate synthase (NADPH/NADH) small chain